MTEKIPEMTTYKSRISIRLLAFLTVICVISFYVPIFVQEAYHEAVIPMVILLLFFLAMKGIKYVIDGETLKIYYFWGIHHDIDIMTIRKIEPSHCLLSSPAASLNRLAIYYNKYDDVYISPRNQEEFIKHIKQINQNIQLS